jgi:hypothetical protein
MLILSLVVIVTGSLLLMTALAFIWIFVYVARDSFGYTGAQGSIYHMLEQFHLRMLSGLAVLGFGAPGAAVVLSFFLLLRKSWPRIATSLLGAVSIVAAAFLLSDSITWVLPAAGYIAFACVILWTPGVTAWCHEHDSATPRQGE